jgi:hypothetical protein
MGKKARTKQAFNLILERALPVLESMELNNLRKST